MPEEIIYASPNGALQIAAHDPVGLTFMVTVNNEPHTVTIGPDDAIDVGSAILRAVAERTWNR